MNKWVLVTGASRGIGKETALYLASNGYNIVLHCSNDVKRLECVLKDISDDEITVNYEDNDIKIDRKNISLVKTIYEF